MNDKKPCEATFSKEDLAEVIRIWDRSAISIIDIRRHLISPEQSIDNYRLPVSMFGYTNGGNAEVSLNDISYSIEHFGIFHGGKGTELSIRPTNNVLEVYMVLYKAGDPPFYKRELAKLLKKINPFEQQYGFVPTNPIFFLEQLRKMYDRWKGATSLQLFHGKVVFYMLVYEIYEELLNREHSHSLKPDAIAMVKRHFDRHYSEQISLQALGRSLNISSSHLRSSFKQRYGVSPQEYLANIRIQTVKHYMVHSDFRLKEIAESTGFYDEYHMSRMFKKHEGISPLAYKAKHTSAKSASSIGNLSPWFYNESSLIRLDKLNGEGTNTMLKQMKSKTVIAAAVSLMMILSACGATTNSNSSSVQMPRTEEATSLEATRVVKAANGDVEVPDNPKRVIADYMVGDVLAFGVLFAAVEELPESVPFYEQLKIFP